MKDNQQEHMLNFLSELSELLLKYDFALTTNIDRASVNFQHFKAPEFKIFETDRNHLTSYEVDVIRKKLENTQSQS